MRRLDLRADAPVDICHGSIAVGKRSTCQIRKVYDQSDRRPFKGKQTCPIRGQACPNYLPLSSFLSFFSSPKVPMWPPFFSSFLSFFSSPYTRTDPPFFSSFLSFFSSPANEGALNVTAIATAMMAINIRFITSTPFERCDVCLTIRQTGATVSNISLPCQWKFVPLRY